MVIFLWFITESSDIRAGLFLPSVVPLIEALIVAVASIYLSLQVRLLLENSCYQRMAFIRKPRFLERKRTFSLSIKTR